MAAATSERGRGNHENATNEHQNTYRRRCGGGGARRWRHAGHGGPRGGGRRDTGPANGGRVDLHPAAPEPGAAALRATRQRPAAVAWDARVRRQSTVVSVL